MADPQQMESLGTIATVVEVFGRRVHVLLPTGERRPAALFGKRLSVVCGDRVRLVSDPSHDSVMIVEVLPRATAFSRTDSRGRLETLAANVSLLVVMLAPEPKPDLFIADRYLAGAAYAGIDALVVLNKIDLTDGDVLAEYRAAGYSTLALSAKFGTHLAEFRARVRGEVLLLAGQSGVGKSTLTNALLPHSQRRTGELSLARGAGRHTTVSSAWCQLPDGGALIDSPGVRDYAPPPVADEKVQRGWREIVSRAPACRFNNCLHLHEPDCAVREAVDCGAITVRRYESYKRLLNLMRQLKPGYERC